MTTNEIDMVLGACDELDIDPPFDYTRDLRAISLFDAIVEIIQHDRENRDERTQTTR